MLLMKAMGFAALYPSYDGSVAAIVIARSEATKQSSFLAAAKKAGLLRFARNDGRD
ncbi:MAG: hypothetical protein GY844_12460 [Bradyrhizobium sp.]|nr:hypothetical protein [Bradyrhizobium sp.]